MKYIIFCIALITLIACNNQQKKEPEKRKIDPILEQLLKKYPNYMDNTIVRQNATDELSIIIDSIINMGYFDDIPLKVFRMGKNPHGKGALVHFYTDNYDRNIPNRLSDKFNFDIIGFMNEDIAKTINEDEKYYVYGKKFKRLSEDEVFLLVNRVYHSPGTSIGKGLYEVYEFTIGDMMCEIDSVKIVSK